MSESFESRRAPEPVGAFPHAKRVGNFLFLSGIGPRLRGSKEIPGVTRDASGTIVSYDIEKQCRAVFENVRLVLEDAGASWNDIVDVTPEEIPRIMQEFGVKTLIHGHTHRPAIHKLQLGEQAAKRIVLGDWDRQGWALQVDESGYALAPFDFAPPLALPHG